MKKSQHNPRAVFMAMVFMIFIVSTSACSKKEPAEKTVVSEKITATQLPADLGRNFTVESITRGAAVFQARCAECHGPQAQGHPGWVKGQKVDKKNKQSFIVASPLDGTGVAHQLKKSQLVKVIKQGIKRNNVPVMPGAKDQLSGQDIEDVITWFQALWPPYVYEAWNKTNGATKTSKRGS